MLDHEVEFGAGRRAVATQLSTGWHVSRDLLDHEALPRRTGNRVALQVAHGGQAQQRMQQPAVTHIDFGRLDQALAHIGQVRFEAPHPQGVDQRIQVARRRGVRCPPRASASCEALKSWPRRWASMVQ